VYAKRYGKELTYRGQVADLQLRAMTTKKGTTRRSFKNFCEDRMSDVVEMRARPDLGSGNGAFTLHLIGHGGGEEEEEEEEKAEEEKAVEARGGSVRRASAGATGAMNARGVSLTLQAWGRLSHTCGADDAYVSAIAAVNGELSRVAPDITASAAIRVLEAWGQIATSGIKLSSVLGQPEWESMMSRVGELELEHQLDDPAIIAIRRDVDKALDVLRAALSTSSSSSSEGASVGATGAMNAHEVSLALYAWGYHSVRWRLDDAQVSAISAVNGEVSRVADAMDAHEAARVLFAWGRLAKYGGLKLSSILAASDWEAMTARVGDLALVLEDSRRLDEALNFLKEATSSSSSSEEEEEEGASTTSTEENNDDDDDDDAPASSSGEALPPSHERSPEPSPERELAGVGARWIAALPGGKRAALQSALQSAESAAETPAEKLDRVVASAASDKTKARAGIRQEVLDADAALRNT
jgi:hypothetical protein